MNLTKEKAITRILTLHFTAYLGSLRTAGFTDLILTIYCKTTLHIFRYYVAMLNVHVMFQLLVFTLQ